MPFKSSGELDTTALIVRLVGDVPSYASTIGSCASIQVDDYDGLDADHFSLTDLCEAVASSAETPCGLTLDDELRGRYCVVPAAGNIVSENEARLLNFVVAPRMNNILAIRYGFRSTYRYGAFVDMFSLSKLRYMLFQQHITASAILDKLTWCEASDTDVVATGIKRTFETALGSQDSSSLKRTAFYLFREYNLTNVGTIRVRCVEDTRPELLMYSACAKTLSINKSIADGMNHEVFAERMATIMEESRYGEE